MLAKNKLTSIVLLASLILTMAVFSFSVHTFAQTNPNLQTSLDEQADLQRQLQDIENQIQIYQQQLNGIKSEKNTLANKIKQLKTKQQQITLQIQETTLNIKSLESQLTETQSSINKNIEHLSFLKNTMTGLVQQIYEKDRHSLVEVLLSRDGFSGFFTELDNYESLNQSLADVLQNIKNETADLQNHQTQLSDQKEQQENLVTIAGLQNNKLSQSLNDQNDLLKQTKGKESNYQSALSDTQARAAQIRNRLYDLLGVGKKITFGEAVQIAQWAGAQTGVRTSFLLAILTQESNLGKNVGTCNRLGDPATKSWKVVMKPERDQEPFKLITAELGMDPDITPVSCPMKDSKGRQMGWGGAMGPAQFIPSTWMGYKDKVKAITGKIANPWDIRDAFIASAIKLKAGGAGTVEGEWAAAMRYFSGGTNVKYRFYGDNVVATANEYQKDIDALK